MTGGTTVVEKRKFPRQGLGVEIVYVLDDDGGNAGVIQDFSREGLFVTYGDDKQFMSLRNRNVETGTIVDIIVSQENKQVTIGTSVVHFNEGGIGLAFIDNKLRSYQILDQARQRDNSVAAEVSKQFVSGNRVLDEGRRLKILKACNDQIKSFLEETLQEYLTVLDEALFAEAGKQKNDAAQHPYFDAIAHYKRNQKNITENVVGKLISDAMDIVHGRYKPQSSPLSSSQSEQSLSLVEKNDFEQWLIVRVVVSRAELQLRDPLIELQLRLDAAFGKEDGKRLQNPYSPAAISQAYHASIHHFHLSSALERLVFKVFQEIVLNNLVRLYKSINNIFIENDVLPNIDITRYLAAEAIKKNRQPGTANVTPIVNAPSPDQARTASDEKALASSSAVVPPASHAAALQASSGALPGSFQSLQEGLQRARTAYSAASNLMRVHRNLEQHSSEEMRQPRDNSETYQPSQQVFRAIDIVQQQILQNSINLSEPGALTHHIAQAASSNQEKLTVQEIESAEMVENLFSNIVDHQRIVAELRSELRKLELPIYKVLLQDPRLFSAEYHPARQFVNYVALLSDRESVNLQTNKQAVVDSIRVVLEHPNNENEGFNEGLGKLDKLVEREKKIIERNVTRVTEACEGQQRIKIANERIEKELVSRLNEKDIPQLFNDFLTGGWKELMRLCFFREGIESRAWEMTLVVVDQLIVRLSPGEYDEAKILFKAEELQKLIKKGLSKIPDSKGNTAALVEELGGLLISGGQDGLPYTRYVAVEKIPATSGISLTKEEKEDKTLQRWIKRARNLKEGQWLEFDAQSESSHLYQLAWISEGQERFVFVNHHGMKVSELALEVIALKLKSGEVVVLSDSVLPAVENGLDSLVQKIYDQLAFESAHDQLTGMKTRKEFERCLAQSVARAKKNNQSFVLIYCDIMQFSVINNTCGYEAGDNLLREVGERFRSVITTDMISGRIGGNEFGVLARVDSERNGFQVATELKAAIEEKRFVVGSQSFVIEAVVSMVGFDHTNDQVLELLRAVESASVIAKKSGHKEIQIVRPGDERIEERDEIMAWVARINRALDLNTLKLRCQKIAPVDGKDGTLPHFEILLTVVDENGEHLPPAEFIRAAEEYSRMTAVDRWVIESVLRWMRDNNAILNSIGGFSINLSGHSMNDDSFLDFMFENLVRYEVPREKLIFEVTETTAVANLDDAADFINEMRGIGCRFSLDDFGAGQSSYAYLRKLPVDFIKIDGAFIRNIASDDVDYALVKSITEMGHFLNKKIIAEYVSDKDILEVVKDIGVDYVQGYYFGKPTFIEELGMLQN